MKKFPFIVAAGRQTAALLRKIEGCGFLPKAATPVLICLLACQITCAQNSTNAVASTNAVTAADTLKQLVASWQATPNGPAGYELAMKMVKLVATMNPKPEIPEEVRGHCIKAETLLKAASTPSDYDLAFNEYLEAYKLAPWWPNIYLDLAVVQEAQKKYDAAIRNLNLYLASNPDDARAAQDKLYQIQAEKDLADKHAADAERQKQEAAAKAQKNILGKWILLKRTDGTIQTLTISDSGNGSYTAQIYPDTLPAGSVYYKTTIQSFRIDGANFKITTYVQANPYSGGEIFHDDESWNLHSSDDGTQLVGTHDVLQTYTVGGEQHHSVVDVTLSRGKAP